MPFFRLDLETPVGLQPAMDLIEFHDLEQAYCDVCIAIPATAAELLSSGINPMLCNYQLKSEDDVLLLEIPFTELVRSLRPSPKSLPSAASIQLDSALLAWSTSSCRAAEAVRKRSVQTILRGRAARARAQELATALDVTLVLPVQEA